MSLFPPVSDAPGPRLPRPTAKLRPAVLPVTSGFEVGFHDFEWGSQSWLPPPFQAASPFAALHHGNASGFAARRARNPRYREVWQAAFAVRHEMYLGIGT